MRNLKRLATTFVALALVIAFSSCEKQIQTEATGSLKLNPKVEDINIGKKSVDVPRDASIPVYVEGVEVSAVGAGGHTAGETFMYTATGTGAMELNDVALGFNTVTATSIAIDYALPHTFLESSNESFDVSVFGGIITVAADGAKYQSFYKWYGEVEGEASFLWWSTTFHKFLVEGEIPVNAMSDFISYIIGRERDQEDGAPIYAIYEGMATSTVVNEDSPVIDIPMTTNYGRQMVTFSVQNNAMLDLYDIEIVGNCPTSPLVDHGGVDGYVQLDGNTHFAVSYWSNATSINGANTHYTLNFREKGSSAILRTDEIDIAVRAGISLWSNVIITEDAFFIDNQALSISYTPLNEEDEIVYID